MYLRFESEVSVYSTVSSYFVTFPIAEKYKRMSEELCKIILLIMTNVFNTFACASLCTNNV